MGVVIVVGGGGESPGWEDGDKSEVAVGASRCVDAIFFGTVR